MKGLVHHPLTCRRCSKPCAVTVYSTKETLEGEGFRAYSGKYLNNGHHGTIIKCPLHNRGVLNEQYKKRFPSLSVLC